MIKVARMRRRGHVVEMDEAATPNRLMFVELRRKLVRGDSLHFVAFDERVSRVDALRY